ncbi:hypothetical protein [Lonepinella sp. BR2474]|uniref:hypothetical protein n=1 Tax=Lonepinella sp. BR2474 TaxID=3434548 RepID=UPI003F6E3D29
MLNQASSWAKEIVVDGAVFYWVSRSAIIEQLPLFYSKKDTVYRHFIDLKQKGLIEYCKIDGQDLIRLTEKGKDWNSFNSEIDPKNSEIDPKNSEIDPKNSDSNPTDKYINNNINKNINKNSPLPPNGESANAEDDGPPLAEKSSLPKNKKLSVDYAGIVVEFNDCVEDTPISQVRVLNDKRRRQILSLAKLLNQQFGTCDVETFRNYFNDFLRQVSARKDRFYFGGGKTGWVANFDYVMRAETFTKTLEDSL